MRVLPATHLQRPLKRGPPFVLLRTRAQVHYSAVQPCGEAVGWAAGGQLAGGVEWGIGGVGVPAAQACLLARPHPPPTHTSPPQRHLTVLLQACQRLQCGWQGAGKGVGHQQQRRHRVAGTAYRWLALLLPGSCLLELAKLTVVLQPGCWGVREGRPESVRCALPGATCPASAEAS